MRLAFSLLVLVLLAGLGWLLFGQGTEPPQDSPDATPSARDGGKAPTLRTAGGAGATDPAAAGAGAGGDGEDASADAASGPRHVVVGRIEGLDGSALRETVVRVRGLREYDWVDAGIKTVEGAPDQTGAFALDVGALRAKHADLRRVRVDVDHPRHVVHKTALDLAPMDAEETRLEEPIHLRPAFVVRGRVRAAEGAPAADARVALYQLQGARPKLDDIDAAWIDRGTTDAEGRFALRTPEPGPVLLGAHAAGHVPQLRRVDVPRDEAPPPQELALARGAFITGRVLLNGQPLPGAEVRALPPQDAQEIDLPWIRATWIGESLHVRDAEATTDPRGAFEIHGLEPGTRNLRVLRVEGYFGRDRTVGWDDLEVAAPALGVVLDLEAAVLDLAIVSGSQPVEGAQVGMHEPQATWRSTRDCPDGTATILLPVGKPLVVSVKHQRYESAERPIRALPAGARVREVVDLGRPKAMAGLRVRVSKADGTPITSAGFVVTDDIAKNRNYGFDSGLGLRHAEDGSFLLEHLEPGAYVLAVFPERAPDATRGTWLVVEREITLVAGRESAVDVTARQGASVVVTVLGSDGKPTEAYASLHTERGAEVPTTWFYSDESSATMTSGGPGPAPSTILPPLAPGEYELRVEADEHVSRTVRFRVTEGETKTLEIALEAK